MISKCQNEGRVNYQVQRQIEMRKHEISSIFTSSEIEHLIVGVSTLTISGRYVGDESQNHFFILKLQFAVEDEL